ncbi:ATP-binding protein [Falsiroseomonas sp. CW058]|uniref:ATP-binding protein n=1 Tax=Falsiroseomonas sp. CW058 TaxID=3388664 RepID=UPI003D31B8AC
MPLTAIAAAPISSPLPGWAQRAPGAAALLVLLAIALGAWNWTAGERDATRIAAARGVVLGAEGLLSALKDAETGQRGFLLTGDEAFLEPYHAGREAVPLRLREMTEAAALAGLPPHDGLRAAAEGKLAWTASVIGLRRDAGRQDALLEMESGRGKALMDAARAEAARTQRQAAAHADAAEAAARRRGLWLGLASLGCVLAACGLLAGLVLVRRRTERRTGALLQGVMEHAPVGLGFLDRRLRLSHANRTLATLGERTLGVEAGSETALPEAVRTELVPRMQAVLAGGKAQTNIAVAVRPPGKEGQVRHLLLGIFPLSGGDEAGGVDGVGLVAMDDTLRRRAEERLRRSEARLRNLVDAIPQLAWMTGPTGEIQWYNRRWYEFTGTAPADMEGWGWRKVHHPEHVERVEARFREAIAAGGAWEDTFPLRGADGRYRWFLSRALPLRDAPDEEDAEGALIGWFGTNTDITELREAEEALAAAKAAAEDANLAKSQFIANMSHELRTPLSAVIGYSEMLEEEAAEIEGGSSFLDDLRKINSNARHLLSLINDVLDLSKIEAGKMEILPEDFDAAALLREVASTVEALVERRRNTLELEVAGDLGEMHSDPVKLRQCLFNLLGNAAKFTEGGRITLSAGRETRGGQDWLTFRVADTGIGMTPEQLDKLFSRFTQADASTTRRFGGTGLGLSITKAFSAMLGGEITVRSEPGQGSAFTLRIPADLRTARAEEDEPAAQIGEAAAAEHDGPAGLVLVVDDDAATRDLLSRFLRREGFAVRCASDGARGLEMARELKPAAILLDVMMPRMDGWAVLSALKADPDLAETPVVMVTVVQERGLAFSLGAADYLNKPVRWERLKRVLDRFRRETQPGLALVVESDEAERAELVALLAGEGWTAEAVATPDAALARLAQPPVPAVLLMELRPGGSGEEFALLREMRRRPELRDLPVIAVTDGEVPPEELEKLRGEVRRIVPAEEGMPEELLNELRRIAPAGTTEGAG